MADFSEITINTTAQKIERMANMEINNEVIDDTSDDNSLPTSKLVYDFVSNSASGANGDFVSYSQSQALTDEQKALARSNIDAIEKQDLLKYYNLSFDGTELPAEVDLNTCVTPGTYYYNQFALTAQNMPSEWEYLSHFKLIVSKSNYIVRQVIQPGSTDQAPLITPGGCGEYMRELDAAMGTWTDWLWSLPIDPNSLTYVDYKNNQSLSDAQKALARSNIGAVSTGEVNQIKEDLVNLVEQTGTEEQLITIIPEEHEGYMNENGNINSASTLYYTQKINVKEGDKLVPHSNTVIPTFRFVTAFNGNNVVYSSGSATTESYTVPAGIDGVIVTMRYDHSITNITQERTVPIYEVKGLSNKADKNQGESNCGKVWAVGEDGNLVFKYIDSDKTKFQKLSKSVTSLSSGNTLTLKEKDITFKNKTMTFYANITEMGTIRIGHGYKAYGGVYFDIDSTNVKRYYSYGGTTDSPTDTLEHNLTISDFIGAVITSTGVDISISVISKSGMFSHTFSGKDSGRNGSIFVTALSGTYTNCQANWHCDDYNKNIYAIGDSCFSLSNPKRWTKYVNDLGFDNWLMLAFPGMGVIDGYNGFVDALNYSIPIFALWCVGMNNPDTDTAISSTWKTYTEKFLAICKEKGITPILCTIPNVIGGSVGDTNISTMRNHSFKNQYVINSGYRYIDFANAVGADADGNWYPNMLSDDGVHPTELGAKSLFAKAVIDMPELLSKTI